MYLTGMKAFHILFSFHAMWLLLYGLEIVVINDPSNSHLVGDFLLISQLILWLVVIIFASTGRAVFCSIWFWRPFFVVSFSSMCSDVRSSFTALSCLVFFSNILFGFRLSTPGCRFRKKPNILPNSTAVCLCGVLLRKELKHSSTNISLGPVGSCLQMKCISYS